MDEHQIIFRLYRFTNYKSAPNHELISNRGHLPVRFSNYFFPNAVKNNCI